MPPGFEAEFPDGSALATEAFLNVGVLTGGVRSAVEGILRGEGITSLAAFNVLAVVDGDPSPIGPSVIAGRMMVTRATMTGLLDSLEARGLIERRPSGADGRQRLVQLTPEGRRITRRLVPEMHRFERDLMSCLSDDELEAFLEFVARLQQRIMALEPSATLGIES